MFIFGFVFVNAIIGFMQQLKAVVAIEALGRTMETMTTVIRSGRSARVSAAELVPGDVVTLQSGDNVPADLRRVDFNYATQVDQL